MNKLIYIIYDEDFDSFHQWFTKGHGGYKKYRSEIRYEKVTTLNFHLMKYKRKANYVVLKLFEGDS